MNTIQDKLAGLTDAQARIMLMLNQGGKISPDRRSVLLPNGMMVKIREETTLALLRGGYVKPAGVLDTDGRFYMIAS